MRVEDDADAPSTVRPHRIDNLERRELCFSFRFGHKSQKAVRHPYIYTVLYFWPFFPVVLFVNNAEKQKGEEKKIKRRNLSRRGVYRRCIPPPTSPTESR